MNDAISRQAAIDGFYEMASDIDRLCTVGDYISFLESLSAQPEITVDGYADGFADGYKQGQKDAHPERGNGKWLVCDSDDPYIYRCDRCNRRSDFLENYCPNCGTKMKEKQEENNDTGNR